jgi:hypothetical protein
LLHKRAKYFLAVLLAARAWACQSVDGDHILAKNLAAARPAFAALDPNLEIGLAPQAGAIRTMSTAELSGLARNHGVAITDPIADVCFERVTEPLTAERLLPVLEKALGETGIEILDLGRYLLPPGTIEFTRAGLAPSGLWHGRVVSPEGRSTPVWVKIRMDRLEMDGKESAALQPPSNQPEVGRGDRVAVEVHSGAARLAFEAKAESSGHAGDSVLVRNPENGRLFQAKVEGKGKVLVQR